MFFTWLDWIVLPWIVEVVQKFLLLIIVLILIFSLITSICICLYRKAQDQQKKVVVAGCVPQAQPRMDYLKGLSIIGVCVYNLRNNLNNIVWLTDRQTDRQTDRHTHTHTNSLTCHSPGCQPAVSDLYWPPCCLWINRPPQERRDQDC